MATHWLISSSLSRWFRWLPLPTSALLPWLLLAPDDGTRFLGIPQMWWIAATMAILLILGPFRAWKAVDEVRDADDALIVCRGKIETAICLTNVENVAMLGWPFPQRVELRLRTASPLGSRIVFIPKMGMELPYNRNKVFVDLSERVARAHRAAQPRSKQLFGSAS